MSISEHSNGLASAIEFKRNRKKQDKRLNNHHFLLHIPHKTKHDSGEPPLYSIKMVQYQLPMGILDASHSGGGVKKALGNAESTLAGIR